MKKVLLALLGLILLAILAYFCFQNKADTIRDDLVSSTNTALSTHNITGIKADLKGDNLEMTDIIRLTGEVPSLELKTEAETLARAVGGVGGVDNQLTITQAVATAVPAAEEVAKIPSEVVAEATKKDPYTLTIIKDEKHKIALNGNVASSDRQNALVAYAEKLFGSENVTNHLKIVPDAPEDWEHISHFALDRLKDVDYGDMKLSDKSYEFTGHLPSPSTKSNFLDGIRSVMSDPDNKYSRYRGDYIITAPMEEPKAITKKVAEKTTSVEICQSKLDTILKDKKVLFEFNKATISKNSYALLDNVLKSMKACSISKLEVAGHTDAAGSETYNKRLSELRSASVKKYFVKKGFDEKKLQARGYGESKPIANNNTSQGRTKNRRIEFIVKGIEK